MVKCILLNGPKLCGKDFVARGLKEIEHSVKLSSFSHYVKLGALLEYGAEQYQRYFEAVKDQGQELLGGFTPRECYVAYGNAMRAIQGQDHFAKVWAQVWAKDARVLLGYKLVVCTDCRLQEEMDAAVEVFGCQNVVLVRVHREGCVWDDENDVGSYLEPSHIESLDFHNDGDTVREATALRLRKTLNQKGVMF